jgi:hypothetical protein
MHGLLMVFIVAKNWEDVSFCPKLKKKTTTLFKLKYNLGEEFT